MVIGTSYFVSKNAAEHYYGHWDDAKEIVEAKLAYGEIHIGKPKLKSGERLVVIDTGRYAIVTEDKTCISNGLITR